MQFVVAAIGCYVLSLALGASRLGALLAGLAGLVAWKAILAAHAGWVAPLATCALVPWLLAAWIHVAERPGPASALGLAIVAAFAFAGGSPQLLYYAALVASPYLLLCPRPDGDRARFALVARRMLIAAAALALGIACNGYLWGSVLADWPWLSRNHDVGNYDFFLSGHGLGLAQLWSLLSPRFGASTHEAWAQSAYFGLVPLALAIFGASCNIATPRSAARRTNTRVRVARQRGLAGYAAPACGPRARARLRELSAARANAVRHDLSRGRARRARARSSARAVACAGRRTSRCWLRCRLDAWDRARRRLPRSGAACNPAAGRAAARARSPGAVVRRPLRAGERTVVDGRTPELRLGARAGRHW